MRWLSPLGLTVASLATLGLSASCHLVGGTDGLFIEELASSSGGTGGGGTGGSSSSSSSTTGHGGEAGSACVPAECSGEDTNCTHRACIDGTCQLVNEAPGTECTDDGGQYCDGMGYCVECTINEHCSGLCQSYKCVEPSCTDGEQSNGETDVDCGGPCGACENGLGCLNAADCVSGICTALVCTGCLAQQDCPDVNEYCDIGSAVCSTKKPWLAPCGNDYECLSANCAWAIWQYVCGL